MSAAVENALKKVSRNVANSYLSVDQPEGMGARVRRTIGRREVPRLDPFLLLDEFNVQKPAGFPDHPHRGFETITYMIDGEVEHEDFAGHRGIIGPGAVQIMTAGRGIVHSEMIHSERPAKGLQLWVNLPAKLKMTEPAYQELTHDQIAKSRSEDGQVEVDIISGTAFDGTKANSYTRVPTIYMIFRLKAGATVKQPIPLDYNAFCYVLGGSGKFGETQKDVPTHHLVVLDGNPTPLSGAPPKSGADPTGDHIWATAGAEGLQFALVAGQPIGEPVVQYGPFVMNTDAEIRQTLFDYSAGRNGFERAPGWHSQAGGRM